jgi:sporulation protein YqfD
MRRGPQGLGWLTVAVSTMDPADLVTRLVDRGVRVSAIARTPVGIRCTLPAADLRAVRRAVRGHGERVRIERRHGMGMGLRRLRRRPFLLLGAVLTALVVGYATPRVWLVAVDGVGPDTAARVVAAAADAGLVTGAVRSTLPRRAVEAAILRQVPGYSWVGLSVRGAVVVVRLHPYRDRPVTSFAHTLVAARDARVVGVSVYMGEALVRVGDHVRRGQPLIRGFTRPQLGPPEAPGPHGPSQAAAAAGIPFPSLMDRLVLLALRRHARDRGV